MLMAATVSIAVLFLLIAVALVVTYNGLVGSRNDVRNSLNQIDVQLKRRHDLIPNLVEAAKGYMAHERQTLDSVTQARASAQNAKGRSDQFEQEHELSRALGRFMVVSENYPELKASGHFQSIQEELVSTENRIAFSRQRYNDCVMQYDTRRQGFPGVLLAGSQKFPDEPYWKIDEAAQREAPVVRF